MILVTVGTQLPFDRLIRIIDEAAPGIGQPVFAQTAGGAYVPQNIGWQAMVKPMEFDALMAEASFIVGHAGVGTVLMAQKHMKPIIVFPRRASLGEHRNEHQLATVAALENRQGIYVARTREQLVELLDKPLLPPEAARNNPRRKSFTDQIAAFLDAESERFGTKHRLRPQT